MPDRTLQATSDGTARSPVVLACIMAGLTFIVQSLVLAISATGGNKDFNQITFHIPVIRQFALE